MFLLDEDMYLINSNYIKCIYLKGNKIMATIEDGEDVRDVIIKEYEDEFDCRDAYQFILYQMKNGKTLIYPE